MARVGRIQTSGLMSVPVLKRIFSKWRESSIEADAALEGMTADGC
jgi:hypothetical protein